MSDTHLIDRDSINSVSEYSNKGYGAVFVFLKDYTQSKNNFQINNPLSASLSKAKLAVKPKLNVKTQIHSPLRFKD